MNHAPPPHPLRKILAGDVVAAAPQLLGWDLVTPDARVRLVEVEAYRGADDPGCHAFGKTKMKNMAMFGEPGTAYVYLCYGCHWMLNVVAHPVGDGSAVLIRAAMPLEGGEQMLARRNRPEREWLAGPGRVCQALDIDHRYNGIDLLHPTSPIRLEPGAPVEDVLISRRIGITVGKGEQLEWRFVDAKNRRWASR